MDNEAAGQLSSMELYCITVAALEGHHTCQLAYCALIDNYNSLMDTSNLKDSACVALPTSPIFAQYNLSYDPEVRENTTMLKDMRVVIHKLLPEDSEEDLTKENSPPRTGDQGSTEDPFGGHSDAVHLSFSPDAFQITYKL